MVSGGSYPYDLNIPLLHFSRSGRKPQDPLTIDQATQGIQIFGATGSGKTSGSGAAIAKAFLKAGFGGLVLCAKPEERGLWERYAAATGRAGHLVVISPEQKWRFNFLDYEMRRAGRGGGYTENLLNLFDVVVEVAEGHSAHTDRDPFWQRAMRQMLRNGLDLLALSETPISLENVAKIIATAPQSREEIGSQQWRETSFCADCLGRANAKDKSERETHDFLLTSAYWLNEYPAMADKTRSSVVMTFSAIADGLLRGVVWEVFGRETNIVPEVTYRDGAIIVLDLPVQEYREAGRVAQAIFKYVWQTAMLRRDAATYPRPCFLWADEAQLFLSSYDPIFQSTARSARACTVYLSQNISGYYTALGADSYHRVNAFLGNLQTKVFHANVGETNQWAAELIAYGWQFIANYNATVNENGATQSGGGSQQRVYKVEPEAFTKLRKGGPENQYCVDAIVMQGGRTFQTTGESYLSVTFSQDR